VEQFIGTVCEDGRQIGLIGHGSFLSASRPQAFAADGRRHHPIWVSRSSTYRVTEERSHRR
jgi:hypothetical protein